MLTRPRKRPAEESTKPDRKALKPHYGSTPGGASVQAEEETRKTDLRPQTETKCQKDVYVQVGKYLLEQFSIPAFRSHATIGIVDRDRVQFYHANHSVILVSSAINFAAANGASGLEKLIAIVIAFSRLSLRDNGILHDLHDGQLFRDNGKLPTSNLNRGAMRMQEGNKLEFGGNEETGPFTLTYGETISHEPSLAGRSTAVLHATSPTWKGVDLVVKISWPGSGRVSETDFIREATEAAKSTAAGEWALNHLPKVFFAQDVVFDSDSTHEKVASLFDNAEFVGKGYTYERRTLRIIIQERLYPLKTLSNVKDIAQVLLDIACSTCISFALSLPSIYTALVHRWLHDWAKILHRDLSLNNIMWRIIKELNAAGVKEDKVCGVLTDYDLSSRTMGSDYTKTSEQRTGTPPYMAFGLLDGTDDLHLYRHDVESLFYIILILAAHNDIQAPGEEGKKGGVHMRQGKLPYRKWFDQPLYEDLAAFKSNFFSVDTLDLSPSFEGFRVWLKHLRRSFYRGFRARSDHACLSEEELEESGAGANPATVPYDDETLGGFVDYRRLVEPTRYLTGELQGLIIRYDPSSSPPSATRANT
jgi:hypothetical protein